MKKKAQILVKIKYPISKSKDISILHLIFYHAVKIYNNLKPLDKIAVSAPIFVDLNPAKNINSKHVNTINTFL